MLYVALFGLLCASTFADNQPQYYSYSPAVGLGSGTSYSLTGDGSITAIRMWEQYSNYIRGVQFRYGQIWSHIAGRINGEKKEIELFEDEVIVQVSGKYASYVQSLVFTTSRGRTLSAGQPSGNSFNHYPSHSQAELRFISGRHSGGIITSIGSHWAVVYDNSTALS